MTLFTDTLKSLKAEGWPMFLCTEFLRNHAKEIINLVEAAEGKKEWVGLTDDEILDIVGRAGAGYPAVVPPYTRGLFKKIEDKLREKNG
jgi:hypothetical protein